jgi:hypothetical protein
MTEENSTCDGEGARLLPGVRYFEIGGGAVLKLSNRRFKLCIIGFRLPERARFESMNG